MIDGKYYKEALLIRRTEDTFLELFAQGKLNGTVHTSNGQEFSAIAFSSNLEKEDFIFSNHRCHGHYLARTGDLRGLIAELMGKSVGTCAGIGSSQHLCNENFYSNGVQGGIVPVSAGLALANKLKNNGNIGIVFIGDGTLGEGVVYETMNIASKWELPLAIVCENNRYAQTTHQSVNLAGDILKRPEAFGIKTFHSNIWELEDLFENAKSSMEFVRNRKKPIFHLVDAYRLNPHSKGDDDRDPEEIEHYRSIDPIGVFSKERKSTYDKYLTKINADIKKIVSDLSKENELPLEDYYIEGPPSPGVDEWEPLEEIDERVVERINHFFIEKMAEDERLVFMGEDVLSPYGGAFKVARDLSVKYPSRVFSTPISEAAITGMANGLALAGMRPYLELMFGDFVTLAMDQIINHASKFHHMYNRKVNCPVVIRTPMGGGRGYGPTHSQSLEKFLCGIDNVKAIAVNNLVDPYKIYTAIHEQETHPVIVIENKLDYARRIGKRSIENYEFTCNKALFPTARIRPVLSKPTITFVTYGGLVSETLSIVEECLEEMDLKPEVIVPTTIHPMDFEPIIHSVRTTGRLVVIEEGSKFFGIGSEVVASVSEALRGQNIIVHRVSAKPVPIPSARALEKQIIPNRESILEEIQASIGL